MIHQCERTFLVVLVFANLCLTFCNTENISGLNWLVTLDTSNDTFPLWKMESAPWQTYLYYFEEPSQINKTLLNLTNPEEFDLGQFGRVKGVWVFPHKHFDYDPWTGAPAETLFAKFSFQSGFSLFQNLSISYYLHKGGVIKLFTGNGDDEVVVSPIPSKAASLEQFGNGWAEANVDFPELVSRFRVELHAPDEDDFVFLDKLVVGPHQGEPSSTISPTPETSTTTRDPTKDTTEFAESKSTTVTSSPCTVAIAQHAPPQLALTNTLDTKNDTFPFWKIDSFPYRGYLYYFNDSSVINKTLLNLTHPDEFDLDQFNGVKGIWVFPHKYFPEDQFESPNVTLIGVLAFQSDFSLFDGSLTVTYFTYNGGEIKIFNDTTEWNQLAWAKFESESETSGWTTRIVNFPTATSRFRIELHANDTGSFVFLDKIVLWKNNWTNPEVTTVEIQSSTESKSTTLEEVKSTSPSSESTQCTDITDTTEITVASSTSATQSPTTASLSSESTQYTDTTEITDVSSTATQSQTTASLSSESTQYTDTAEITDASSTSATQSPTTTTHSSESTPDFTDTTEITDASSTSSTQNPTTLSPGTRSVLDIKNDSFPFWQIYSYFARQYLYYFDEPCAINKALLNLTHPEEFDLKQFEGVKGVWVFPHKHFSSDPAETLVARYLFNSGLLYGPNLWANYYAHRGGEIKLFIGDDEVPSYHFCLNVEGWNSVSFDFPSSVRQFRVELHAQNPGDFVFLDKIIVGPKQGVSTSFEPPTEFTGTITDSDSITSTSENIVTAASTTIDESTPTIPTHLTTKEYDTTISTTEESTSSTSREADTSTARSESSTEIETTQEIAETSTTTNPSGTSSVTERQNMSGTDRISGKTVTIFRASICAVAAISVYQLDV